MGETRRMPSTRLTRRRAGRGKLVRREARDVRRRDILAGSDRGVYFRGVYDSDIRCSLRSRMASAHEGDPTTVILEELGLRQGSVRVDLAVVNGSLKGYEIKSAADTLKRLPSQAAVYNEVMDEMSIVLTERDRADALDAIPSWWEVVVATRDGEDVVLSTVREGGVNPSVDARALAELLWHPEAMQILRAKNAARGLSRAGRASAWDRIAQVCSLDEIREAVRARLKERAARRSGR